MPLTPKLDAEFSPATEGQAAGVRVSIINPEMSVPSGAGRIVEAHCIATRGEALSLAYRLGELAQRLPE